MTIKEIIDGLNFIVDALFDPNTGEKYTEPRNDLDKTTIDACKGAIELLVQKSGHWIKGYTFPDGDYWKCNKCNELIKVKYPMNYCSNCGAKMGNDEKLGKWIPIPYQLEYETDVKCSLCSQGVVDGIDYNYCPNCGAKMIKDCDKK